MIGLKNIENDSGIINCLTIMKNMPNTKENEPFTGFICWADTISKPRNRIYKSFYVCAQNDKFGEYIIHNNARLTVFLFLDCRGEDHFVLTMFFKRITKDQKQIWEGVFIAIQKKYDDLSTVQLKWVFKCIIELLPNIFLSIFIETYNN